MRRSRNLLIVLLALAAIPISNAWGGDNSAAKHAKAIDKLSFAVEEIDIVRRAVEEGVLEDAHKHQRGHRQPGGVRGSQTDAGSIARSTSTVYRKYVSSCLP